ncbi:MAG TPA: hypothetical protein VGB68_12785 [Pyrinomonadaceae bacterium]
MNKNTTKSEYAGDYAASNDFYRKSRQIGETLDGFVAARRRQIERALEFAARADELRRRIRHTLKLPDRIFRDNYTARLALYAGRQDADRQ